MNDQDSLNYLRKETLNIYNRIHSIAKDAEFITTQVHEAYPDLPLLANLRCGAWYVDPQISNSTPVYFKSTDGHFDNWKFNLRRPNIHLLPIILSHNGIILVDSTRTGKRIPDALSKTVPIWCAVINIAMLKAYPDIAADPLTWNTKLYTPPTAVSPQEHSQIQAKLQEWANTLLAVKASSYELPRLPQPLRPIWITPATAVFPTFSIEEQEFLPVICVSASEYLAAGDDRRSNAGFIYVQGSGDDHELWGMGLTPSIYWKHKNAILDASPTDVESLVRHLVATSSSLEPSVREKASCITTVNGLILVASIADLNIFHHIPDESDISHVWITSHDNIKAEDYCGNVAVVHSPSSGKKGQLHFLKTVLPSVVSCVSSLLANNRRVCIACDTGHDLAIGAATVVLQCFFDDTGAYVGEQKKLNATKQSIRMRLEWIISNRPEANPSRTTLKRANEYLLSSAAFRTS